MTTSIEQEYKTMITKDQYNLLFKHFNFQPSLAIKQTNTYYDTADEKLKDKHAAFRLRNIGNRSEWTLKQKTQGIRSIELTQENATSITVPESLTLDLVHEKSILDFFKQHQIKLGSLKATYRISTLRHVETVSGGEFFLDHSTFNDRDDYELEFEVNAPHGHQVWEKFMKEFKIDYQQAKPKIARAAYYQTL